MKYLPIMKHTVLSRLGTINTIFTFTVFSYNLINYFIKPNFLKLLQHLQIFTHNIFNYKSDLIVNLIKLLYLYHLFL